MKTVLFYDHISQRPDHATKPYDWDIRIASYYAGIPFQYQVRHGPKTTQCIREWADILSRRRPRWQKFPWRLPLPPFIRLYSSRSKLRKVYRSFFTFDMRELEQNDFKLRRSIVCQKAPKKITEMQKCNRSVKLFSHTMGLMRKRGKEGWRWLWSRHMNSERPQTL